MNLGIGPGVRMANKVTTSVFLLLLERWKGVGKKNPTAFERTVLGLCGGVFVMGEQLQGRLL